MHKAISPKIYKLSYTRKVVDVNLQKVLGKDEKGSKTFILCVPCGKYMSLVRTTVICHGCDFKHTYPPQCDIRQLDSRCSRDHHTLLQLSFLVAGRKVWIDSCIVCAAQSPLCPYLAESQMAVCQVCSAPTVFAASRDNKQLFELCLTCNNLILLMKDVTTARVLAQRCICGAALVSLVVGKDAENLPGEKFESACFHCEERLKRLALVIQTPKRPPKGRRPPNRRAIKQ